MKNISPINGISLNMGNLIGDRALLTLSGVDNPIRFLPTILENPVPNIVNVSPVTT